MLSRRLSAHYKFFRLCFHDMFCRTNAWNIFNVVCRRYHAKTMVLEYFGWIAFSYSCTKLIDYPESSAPLVFLHSEIMLRMLFNHALETASVLPASANMVFRMLSRRRSAHYKFFRLCFQEIFAGPMINPWNILKDLRSRMQMVFCMQLQNNGAWILWMDCVYLQLHKAHWLSWKYCTPCVLHSEIMLRMLVNHALGTVCTMFRPHSAILLCSLKVVLGNTTYFCRPACSSQIFLRLREPVCNGTHSTKNHSLVVGSCVLHEFLQKPRLCFHGAPQTFQTPSMGSKITKCWSKNLGSSKFFQECRVPKCRIGHIFKPRCFSCCQKAEAWYWYYSHGSSASTTCKFAKR